MPNISINALCYPILKETSLGWAMSCWTSETLSDKNLMTLFIQMSHMVTTQSKTKVGLDLVLDVVLGQEKDTPYV